MRILKQLKEFFWSRFQNSSKIHKISEIFQKTRKKLKMQPVSKSEVRVCFVLSILNVLLFRVNAKSTKSGRRAC